MTIEEKLVQIKDINEKIHQMDKYINLLSQAEVSQEGRFTTVSLTGPADNFPFVVSFELMDGVVKKLKSYYTDVRALMILEAQTLMK